MRYYETIYIVNPNLENEVLDKTMVEIGKELEKTKSKLINHRVWGKKRLAYPIEKQKYGSFILMQFEGGDQSKMVDFDTWMKLNNSVLRHMIVGLDNKPDVYVEESKKEPGVDEEKTSEPVEDGIDNDDLPPEGAVEPEPEDEDVDEKNENTEQKIVVEEAE
ncbi:MAG TPA: 30S ribosomal protein S6 [Candidatus Marinimicrobia bacterium]|jgi:small subunit ribosomal protein S6|nr:30S ribosomal protein S6 [Candidatus Neomarinimicrobiota bacterium]